MRKPNRQDSKYYREIGQGELGSTCDFLEWKFNKDMKEWRESTVKETKQ